MEDWVPFPPGGIHIQSPAVGCVAVPASVRLARLTGREMDALEAIWTSLFRKLTLTDSPDANRRVLAVPLSPYRHFLATRPGPIRRWSLPGWRRATWCARSEAD
jgi:hypothetical protein